MKKTRIGILGYGEIGKAIHKFYKISFANAFFDVFVRDIDRDDGLTDIDFLNVAIPFNDSFDFVDVVCKTAVASGARVVIVHSTVAVGTTAEIKKRLGKEVLVAHSPCRGVHPYLYEGIKTFLKFVGSPERHDAVVVSHHLEQLGIHTHVCENAETSELAKILDTSYYGVCIAYHGEAAKACEKFGASFKEAMTLFNETYNEGYTKLGKCNVVRPVLTPPSEPIGGHCVVQNAELLKKQFQSEALDLILKYKKK